MNTLAFIRMKKIILPAVLGALITFGPCARLLAQGPPPGISPGVEAAARLSQNHVPADVVVEFLKSKGYAYDLSVDDVIYLNSAGVSKVVLDFMLANSPSRGVAPSFAASSPVAPPPTAPPIEPPAAPIAPPDGSVAPPPNLNLGYFQTQLSPYGQWIDVPPYGQVWRPAAADAPGWRPYSQEGHWVFTASGWFWHTDSPWGALVFHYGRWSLDPSLGWIWVPGYNWGPSWVAWRHAEGYYGWAPLPPAAVFRAGVGLRYHGLAIGANIDFGLRADCFTFVGCNNIFDHDYRAVWVPRERVSVIFGGSVIRNSYHVDHGRFVVEGFGREHIIRHSDIKVVNVVSVSEQVRVQNVTVVKNIKNVRNETNVKNVTNVRNVGAASSTPATAKTHPPTEPSAHATGSTPGTHAAAPTAGGVTSAHASAGTAAHPAHAAPTAGAAATPHSATAPATHPAATSGIHSAATPSTPSSHTTTPTIASQSTTHSTSIPAGHSSASGGVIPATKSNNAGPGKSTAKSTAKPATKPTRETK